jgi:hypothetical protein
MAERIDRHLCAAFGHFPDRTDNVPGLPAIDRRHRTKFAGEGEFLLRQVDGDDIGTHRGGDHDGR